jgi:hypothetical protein
MGGKFGKNAVETRASTSLHPHVIKHVKVNNIVFKTLYHALCWAIMEVNDGVFQGVVNNMSTDELSSKLVEVKAARGASWDDNRIVCVCFYVILQVVNRIPDFEASLSTMPGWSFKYVDNDTIMGINGANQGSNIYGRSLTLARNVCNLLGAANISLESYMVGLNSLYGLRSGPASTFDA